MTNEPGEAQKQSFESLDPVSKNNALKDFFADNFEKYRDLRNRKPNLSLFHSQNLEEAISRVSATQKELRDDRKGLGDLSNKLRRTYLDLDGVNIADETKEYIVSCFNALLIYGKPEDLDIMVWFNGRGGGIYSQDPKKVKNVEIQTYHMALEQLILQEAGYIIGEDMGRFPPLPKSEFMRQWDKKLTDHYKPRF